MKVGLIARSDPRGLGIQTKAVYDHLRPDRTLVVDMGQLGRGYPTHHDDWYPDGLVVPFDGHRFNELTVRLWLDGLDVVYTAETPYDHRLPTWCREHGVALVVHLNPEFDHWGGDPTNPVPDTFWSATTWRRAHHPTGTRIVPMPIPDAHLATEARTGDRGFLHVIGRRALADRAGTLVVQRSWLHARQPQRWTITAQDRIQIARPPRRIDLHFSGPVEDRWELYELGDVLVLPRRYGGLCLPALEAMAQGLAVVMPAASPNDEWPIVGVMAGRGPDARMPGGVIETVSVNPPILARRLDQLVTDPALVTIASAQSIEFAKANTWSALEPMWRQELALAADRIA